MSVKIGKSIISFLEDEKKKGAIENFKLSDVSDTYLEIDVKVNEAYGINICPEARYFTSSKKMEWVINVIQDGHTGYYGNDRTQKEACKTLEDRINYFNRVYKNKLGEKYKSLSQEELIKVLVHRDIEINKLTKQIKALEDFISNK